MGTRKQYTGDYESKIVRVMERLGVSDYHYNWDRFSAYVEFKYKGQAYRFEHDVQKAEQRKKPLKLGSDCFAKIVLSLERLALMVEDGIYDLSTWVAGMKYLPPPVAIPQHFALMGFTEIPSSVEEVKDRYKKLVKVHHPDTGGAPQAFESLQKTYEDAMRWFAER